MASLKKKKFDNVMSLTSNQSFYLFCQSKFLESLTQHNSWHLQMQDEYEFEVRSDKNVSADPGNGGKDKKKDDKAPVEAVRRF